MVVLDQEPGLSITIRPTNSYYGWTDFILCSFLLILKGVIGRQEQHEVSAGLVIHVRKVVFNPNMHPRPIKGNVIVYSGLVLSKSW